MKNKAFLAIFLLSFLGAAYCALAQFTPQEIAQREYWEDFLKTADIIKSEPIGEGVTKPWRLYLKKGDVEKRAAWKNPSGTMLGFWEGWQYEIAAYRLDKLLGLNMISPTIEREFNGKKGALSLWADIKFSLLDIQERGIKIPDSVLEQVDNMKYITRLWACLIANDDVTQQNVLYTEDWRTILIDNSRSFRSSGEFTEKLMYGAHGIKTTGDGRPILFRRIPRWLFEKIKTLDLASIKQAVGPYLTDKEAEAIIARKKLILDEIAEMIKQNGEDKVLY
jgi:hypothetical protein